MKKTIRLQENDFLSANKKSVLVQSYCGGSDYPGTEREEPCVGYMQDFPILVDAGGEYFVADSDAFVFGDNGHPERSFTRPLRNSVVVRYYEGANPTCPEFEPGSFQYVLVQREALPKFVSELLSRVKPTGAYAGDVLLDGDMTIYSSSEKEESHV